MKATKRPSGVRDVGSLNPEPDTVAAMGAGAHHTEQKTT